MRESAAEASGRCRTGRERDRLYMGSRLNWPRVEKGKKRVWGKKRGPSRPREKEQRQESTEPNGVGWLYMNEKLGKGKPKLLED